MVIGLGRKDWHTIHGHDISWKDSWGVEPECDVTGEYDRDNRHHVGWSLARCTVEEGKKRQ